MCMIDDVKVLITRGTHTCLVARRLKRAMLSNAVR